MGVMTGEIRIGTYGWRHANESTSFYDPNLPPEWRLSWYANHFRIVVIPASYEVDAGKIERWLEDTDPAFRFILELDRTPLVAKTDDNYGLTLRATERLFNGQLDAFLYRPRRISGQHSKPPPIVPADLTNASFCVERGESRINEPVDAGSRFDDVAPGKSALDSVVYSSCIDLPQIRILLESMRQAQSKNQALIFTDEKSAYTDAQQARILNDLLTHQ